MAAALSEVAATSTAIGCNLIKEVEVASKQVSSPRTIDGQ